MCENDVTPELFAVFWSTLPFGLVRFTLTIFDVPGVNATLGIVTVSVPAGAKFPVQLYVKVGPEPIEYSISSEVRFWFP